MKRRLAGGAAIWVPLAACQLATVKPGTLTCTVGGSPCPDGLVCQPGDAGLSVCVSGSTSGGTAGTAASSSGSSGSGAPGTGSSASGTSTGGTTAGLGTASSGSGSSGGTSSAGTTSGGVGPSTAGSGGTAASSSGSTSGASTGGTPGSSGSGAGTSSTGGSASGGGSSSGTAGGGSSSGSTSGGACGGLAFPCCAGGTCNSIAGLECEGSVCVCTPSSCPSGCCDGNGCELGDAPSACGDGGGTCDVCVTGAEQNSCEPTHVCCGGASQPCCANSLCGYGFACQQKALLPCALETSCQAYAATTHSDSTDVSPAPLAIDANPSSTATSLYFADDVDGGPIRFDPAGGGPATLAYTPDYPATALALDPTGSTLYWVTPRPKADGGGFDGGEIWRCALNGTSHGCATETVVVSRPSPITTGLVVDDAGNLYWGERDGLFTCNVGSGPCGTLATNLSNRTIAGFAFDSSGDIYVVGGAGGLSGLEVRTPAGQITTLFEQDAGAAKAVAVAGSGAVYFIYGASILSYEDGGIGTLPTPAGSCPDALAADANGTLYWTDPCHGALYKQISCGPLESLWNQGSSTPGGTLAIDATRAFWTDPGSGVYSLAR
jgi:hypothetical protein